MDAGELTRKKCVPCHGGVPPLEPEKARELLAATPGWEMFHDGKRIRRTFTLDSFPEAIEFVRQVAELAEEEGHHPDIDIRYRNVTLVLYTHAIDALHENDFIMAAKINELFGG